MRQTMRVVGCGVMNVLASCQPYRVRVGPERSDEDLGPYSVDVVSRNVGVEVLKDHPVAGDKSSYERIGSKRELLLEDGVEDSFLLAFVEQRSRSLSRGVVVIGGDDGCNCIDYQRVGVDFAQLGL